MLQWCHALSALCSCSAEWHLGKVAFLEVFDGGVLGQVFLESLPEVLDENVLVPGNLLPRRDWITSLIRDKNLSPEIPGLDLIRSTFHRCPVVGNLLLG